jgi:hypothetical protein
MRGTEVSEFIDLAYIWQERATEAEAEVERLIKINQECEQEAHIQDEILRRYKAENAKLRKVVEAAREWINCPCEDIRECSECTAFKFRNALAELDGEGER